MQSLWAITWLTWKAAVRFRLFLVVLVLLLGSVVALPLLLKDDGTASGFTQILLTYTLGTIASLLGLSTLWISCSTLARDIEECQMQVVAVKPIARWQIWLGKWLGLASLNAVLLALAGGGIYALLQWRAARLPAAVQAQLRSEVLVARGSVRPKSLDAEINAEADRRLRERIEKNPVDNADLKEVRKQILGLVTAEFQLVPRDYIHLWELDLSQAMQSLRDKPLQLRVKFNAADQYSPAPFMALWQIGSAPKTRIWRSGPMSLASDTFHEFSIPPNLFDDNGLLTVGFINPNETALLFPLDDGMEVLYPSGSFGPNFVRGLCIIWCWMSVLAALGLAAASFLSFPVAAFASLSVLALVLSTGTMANAVEEGTIADYNAEKGIKGFTPIDVIVIPMFKAMLKVINLAKDFSPVDSLSTGRNISWSQLGLAFAQVILLLGGIVGLFGIVAFTRRELATAQGTQ